MIPPREKYCFCTLQNQNDGAGKKGVKKWAKKEGKSRKTSHSILLSVMPTQPRTRKWCGGVSLLIFCRRYIVHNGRLQYVLLYVNLKIGENAKKWYVDLGKNLHHQKKRKKEKEKENKERKQKHKKQRKKRRVTDLDCLRRDLERRGSRERREKRVNLKGSDSAARVRKSGVAPSEDGGIRASINLAVSESLFCSLPARWKNSLRGNKLVGQVLLLRFS